MKSQIRKYIYSVANYVYILAMIYLAVLSLGFIAKGYTEGFSNLEIKLEKLPATVGIPLVILLVAGYLSKKVSNNAQNGTS